MRLQTSCIILEKFKKSFGNVKHFVTLVCYDNNSTEQIKEGCRRNGISDIL